MRIAEAPLPFPTFVGIGVPRAGTTWLHEILSSHPDVAMPRGRKELHYFDQNFERGPEWYRSWFEPGPATVVGEITPHYLYDPGCIPRIQDAGITRLLVILREPVARAISHHRFRNRVDGTSLGFEAFLAEHPEAVDWGRYATHLSQWMDAFGREAITALRFEQAVTDVAATLNTLADFLGVDPARFPAGTGRQVVNDSGPARYPRAFALAKRIARRARRADATWIGDAARRTGLERVLRSRSAGRSHAVVEQGAVAWLRTVYAAEIDELEQLLGWDLDDWRRGTVTGAN